jgi:two-component sensor histidine kinase
MLLHSSFNNRIYLLPIVIVGLLLHVAPSFAQSTGPVAINNNHDFDRICDNQNKLTGLIKQDGFDSETYFEQAQRLVNYAEDQGDIKRLIKAKNLYVRYYNNIANDLELIARGNELMAYAEFYDLPLSVYVLDAVKQAYERNELFEEELEVIPVLHRQGQKWKPEMYSKRNVDADLALVYYRLSNFEEAISKFRSRIKFHETKGNYYELSGIHNNCGLAFAHLNRKDSAYHHFQLAISYLDTILKSNIKDKTRRSYIYYFRKVVRVNSLQHSPNTVSTFQLQEAIQEQLRLARIEGETHIVVGSYKDLAKLANDKGNYELALNYCDSALNRLKTFSNVKLFKAILQQKTLSHIRLGNTKEAEEVLQLQEAFSDSIQIIRTQNEHNIALVRFETQQRIQELREARQEAEAERRVSKTRSAGLIATGILLVITLILLNRVYLSRKKAQKQVVTINTMLNEKNLLFKEVHHRIKNNLQMVSGLLDLHALKIDHNQIEILVTDTKRHIASMALVHQMLYQDDHYGAVDAHTYFDTLVSNTLGGLGRHAIIPNLNMNKVQLPIDKVIPIGLALCEMLVNTYKYAYPNKKGAVDIALSVSDGTCIFSYADYGVGVKDEELFDEDSGSIGSTLINLLVEEIGGELEIIHTNGLKYVMKYSINDG